MPLGIIKLLAWYMPSQVRQDSLALSTRGHIQISCSKQQGDNLLAFSTSDLLNSRTYTIIKKFYLFWPFNHILLVLDSSSVFQCHKPLSKSLIVGDFLFGWFCLSFHWWLNLFLIWDIRDIWSFSACKVFSWHYYFFFWLFLFSVSFWFSST